MTSTTTQNPDSAAILAEAFANAGCQLRMGQSALARVIGADGTAGALERIETSSEAGEHALLFVRCYRALYAVTGGQTEQMVHWMHTENHHTGGVPAEQATTPQGLKTVVEYLEAIRGKL